jgi:hypothetical protein
MLPITLAIPTPIQSSLLLHPGFAPAAFAVLALLAIAALAVINTLPAQGGALRAALRVLPLQARSRPAGQRSFAA